MKVKQLREHLDCLRDDPTTAAISDDLVPVTGMRMAHPGANNYQIILETLMARQWRKRLTDAAQHANMAVEDAKGLTWFAGSVLIWTLLVGILAFGIIHRLEFTDLGIVVPANRYVAGNPQAIPVLGISPKIDMPGFLMLKVRADNAHRSKEILQSLFHSNRHFPILTRLQRKRLEPRLLDMGESRGQAIREYGEHEAAASYSGNASAHVRNVELHQPRMIVRLSEDEPPRSRLYPDSANNEPRSKGDLGGSSGFAGLLGDGEQRQDDSSEPQDHKENSHIFQHDSESVLQKHLTQPIFLR